MLREISETSYGSRENEAETRIDAEVGELRIGLGLEKHPRIRERLADIGPHFDDSVEIAKMIRALYEPLREKLGLGEDGPERLMRAAILHDIGKSGPPGEETPFHDAVRRLFRPPARPFERIVGGRAKTIREFISEQGLDDAGEILSTLKRYDVDPDRESMIEFWRRHVGWTYDLLKSQVGPDIDEQLIEVAASHHLYEGKDPAHLDPGGAAAGMAKTEIFKLSALLEIVDKYQASRSRQGFGHVESIKILERRINAQPRLPEPLRRDFRAVIEVLGESGDELAEFFKKNERSEK